MATPMRLDFLTTLVSVSMVAVEEMVVPKVPLRFRVDAIRSFVRCFGISILIR